MDPNFYEKLSRKTPAFMLPSVTDAFGLQFASLNGYFVNRRGNELLTLSQLQNSVLVCSLRSVVYCVNHWSKFLTKTVDFRHFNYRKTTSSVNLRRLSEITPIAIGTGLREHFSYTLDTFKFVGRNSHFDFDIPIPTLPAKV